MGIIYKHSSPFLQAAQALLKKGKAEAIAPTRQTARCLKQQQPYSLSSLAAELLWQKGQRVLNPLEQYQQLKQAIATTLNPTDLEGTVQTWRRAMQELLQASPNLDGLKAFNTPKIQQLHQVIQQYQAQLQETKTVDPAAVLWQAIALGPVPQTLCIYGYPDPQVDEIAFIEAIAAADSLLYLPHVDDQPLFSPQGELIKRLQGKGWQLDDSQPETQSLGDRLSQKFFGQNTVNFEPPTVQAHVYPNWEAEARGTLGQIKQLLQQGVAARKIAIVTNEDNHWGPLLLHVAQEYEVPLSLPNPISLQKTRLGAWLEQLLTIIETNYSFEVTAQWLSHPLTHPLGREFWQVARTLKPNHFEAWQALTQEHYQWDLAVLQPPQQGTFLVWREYLKEILNVLDVRRRALPWVTETVAYKKFIDGLDSLTTSLTEIMTWEMFQAEIRTSLQLLTTPAYPMRGGVGVHNPQNLIGAQYDYIFCIDGAEGVMPRPLRDEPVLDFYTRKQLSDKLPIEGAIAKARREQFQFYSLLQVPQKQFTFSYSTLGQGEGRYRSQVASIYFKKLGLQPEKASVAIAASVAEARQFYLTQSQIPTELQSKTLDQAIAAHQIEQRRLQKSALDEYQGLIGMPFPWRERIFSASQLLQLGQCPFKWFAGKVLKLAALDEPETTLEPSQRGILYHKVLELALNAYRKNPDLDLTDFEQLKAWFIEAEDVLKLPKLSAWERQRTEHIQTLQRAIAAPEFLPEGRHVFRLEDKIQFTWQDFQITGYIDRIDQISGTNELVIMDYKTSSSPPKGIQDKSGALKLDLQLPIYEAAVQHQYPEFQVKQNLYYSLTKGEKLSAKFPDEKDLQAAGDRLKTHLEEGSYPVAPDKKYDACKYCDFKSVCRINREEQE
ncbi:PD-(D/E)XK nuclease family protein [Picosynechococcus sp. PCC 7117]|uniref:PD-(D/E)XK nuclease family protein n=1 Tax=Picosynechococcus sp. PCC 7117 TaxID=195498 RepID=UPI000810866A|nr:PD-(D/E)XK nuclease family protein [Picosynechococcus sp. PCC 7117]ANV89065.1 hypothetical protein AWQ22_15855 [Picosynechococcus sp. PCC 7117]